MSLDSGFIQNLYNTVESPYSFDKVAAIPSMMISTLYLTEHPFLNEPLTIFTNQLKNIPIKELATNTTVSKSDSTFPLEYQIMNAFQSVNQVYQRYDASYSLIVQKLLVYIQTNVLFNLSHELNAFVRTTIEHICYEWLEKMKELVKVDYYLNTFKKYRENPSKLTSDQVDHYSNYVKFFYEPEVLSKELRTSSAGLDLWTLFDERIRNAMILGRNTKWLYKGKPYVSLNDIKLAEKFNSSNYPEGDITYRAYYGMLDGGIDLDLYEEIVEKHYNDANPILQEYMYRRNFY